MNPSESVSVAIAEVREKHDATSKSLTFHYERSSEWLTEAIQVRIHHLYTDNYYSVCLVVLTKRSLLVSVDLQTQNIGRDRT